MRASRRVLLGVLAAVTGLVLALDVTGVIAGPLGAALSQDEFADTSAAPAQAPAARPVPVLAPLGSVVATAPSPDAVATALAPFLRSPALGDDVAASVVDVATGTSLLNRRADVGATPASTTKLVTAAAALRTLGVDTRLATSVVDGGDGSTIVLVGGGDPTLRERATRGTPEGPTLATLAERTAEKLLAAGRSQVRLAIDDSLFAPPTEAASWEDDYVEVGVVSPVTALSIDGGRVDPGSRTRSPDPSAAAGRAFAALLRDEGIRVTGSIRSVQAQESSPTLAQVQSPPVGRIVDRMLLTSDNDVAEALGHLVGVEASGSGTFDGGARASLAVLGELGVPVAGVRLLDASGLSRSNLIPPTTLTALLRVSASVDHPELRGVLTGMPVAGLSGSLSDRFEGPATGTAAGDVRGKTGTLTGVTSLSGVVVDRDGRQLAYAVIADAVPEGANPQAEAAIDRLVARLAACGCA